MDIWVEKGAGPALIRGSHNSPRKVVVKPPIKIEVKEPEKNKTDSVAKNATKNATKATNVTRN